MAVSRYLVPAVVSLSLLAAPLAGCRESGNAGKSAQQTDWAPIPAADGTLRDGFTYPFSLIERSDGSVILTDRQLREVWRADFGTGRREPFGRQGNGPGEYRYVAELLPLPDDSIAVLGFMIPAHLAVLDSAGTPARTIRMSAYADQIGARSDFDEYPELARADSQYRLYGARQAGRAIPGGGIALLDSVPIMRLSVASGIIDTVATLPVGDRVGWKGMTPDDRSFTVGLGMFAARNDWTVLPDGTLVLVDARRFTLGIVHDGIPVRTVTVEPIGSLPVREDVWARHVDSVSRSIRGTPMFRGRLAEPLSGASMGLANEPEIRVPDKPVTWPPVATANARVHAAHDLLWIPVTGPQTPERQYWAVVDTTGALHGRFELAPRTQLLEVNAAHVYTVRTDDDDLRWVSRHENPVRR